MNYLLIFIAMSMAGCSSFSAGDRQRKNIYSEADPNKPLVESKYSLQADRTKLDELRKEVPEQKKIENDQLAQSLSYFAEVKKEPSEIRNEFDRALRKKRELMDKDLTKEREVFTKNEKKQRDEFLKSQSLARDTFNRGKHTREERAEYYKDLDDKRAEHFANERERRGDFESDLRDKRKNFEDYAREKNSEFNQEYRAYIRKYEDMKKEKLKTEKLKESSRSQNSPSAAGTVAPFLSSEVSELDREVEEARRKAGSSLAPGE